MQTTAIPVSVCDSIERACRSFIWGSSSNQRKMSLVKWSKVCQPELNGGLGMRDMRAMNDAFLMKIGLGMLTKPNSLWVKVLKSKYVMLDLVNANRDLPSSGSYLWRAVCSVWKNVKARVKWSLGDGKKVKFWLDNWVFDNKPLLFHATGLIPPMLLDLTIADCVTREGNLQWDLFNHLLPSQILLHISACKPPCVDDGEDRIFWSYSKSGHFTISSAYNLLTSPNRTREGWNVICRW